MAKSTSKKEISLGDPNEKTFEKLCEEHQNYCRIRNLSPSTMKTYRINNRYFIAFVGENFLCSKINQKVIDNYKMHLFNERQVKAITVNTYVRNLSAALKYGMQRGNIKAKIEFRQAKVQEEIKPIYTEGELKILLKKPDIRKRGFAEFRNWAIISFLLATGVRARELRNIMMVDIDLENDLIRLQVTKNKKARYIPISSALKHVMTEYLRFRQSTKSDDYLFPNIYGEMLPVTTLQMSITKYCKKRGVTKYSLHLFRHCFATNYLRAGGNPLTLQRILGHSTLKMVNRYVQMNTADLQRDIDKYDPLDNIVRKRIEGNNSDFS